MSKVHKKGFTLIELLVVISIISLLSAVVLSAVNTARIKAENARKLSIMQEYEKAMLLVYDKTGGYPLPASLNFFYCVGVPADNLCGWNNGWNVDTAVNTSLGQFIALPLLQPITSPVTGNTFEGPVYSCTAQSGSVCTSANIRWFTDPAGTCTSSAVSTPINGLIRCVDSFN